MSATGSLYDSMVADGDDPEAPRRIRVEHRGDRAVVTLDEADRLNVLSAPLVRQLRRALDGLVADSDVRSVVLTGADPGFSAGGDLKMMRAATEQLSHPEGGADVWRWIRREFGGIPRLIAGSDTIFIAALNGAAAGVGLAWALNCDLVIASDRGDRPSVRPPRPDPRGRHELGAHPSSRLPGRARLLPARRPHRCGHSASAGARTGGRRARRVAGRCRRMGFAHREFAAARGRDDQAIAACHRGRRLERGDYLGGNSPNRRASPPPRSPTAFAP